MEKHSIHINILGRQFPAVVDAEEAAVIQEAVETINAKIREFKNEYSLQDNLNLVIMCCLDIMTEFLKYKAQNADQAHEVLNELSVLEQKLDTALELTQHS